MKSLHDQKSQSLNYDYVLINKDHENSTAFRHTCWFSISRRNI